jgi:hypothetical protein
MAGMDEPVCGAAAAPKPPDWLHGADGVAFPPPPWHLAATLLLGVFVVPFPRLPDALRGALPDGVRPVRPVNRAAVGVAFVRYHPEGVLAYRELLVAVLGLERPGALRCSIGQIWVDSAASRSGGRDLWAIPKDLGRFGWQERADGLVRCELAGVARLAARPGRALVPWPVRTSLVTAQHRGDGAPVLARSRIVARPRALQGAWVIEPDGPLGYLAGRRPRAGIALAGAELTFGTQAGRVPPIGDRRHPPRPGPTTAILGWLAEGGVQCVRDSATPCIGDPG